MMLDNIDREAAREGEAISKSRNYAIIPRRIQNRPERYRCTNPKNDLDILRILNILGGK